MLAGKLTAKNSLYNNIYNRYISLDGRLLNGLSNRKQKANSMNFHYLFREIMVMDACVQHRAVI